MARDPPSPSALAIEDFAATWAQQVDGVFQCPPCHDWTNSKRASLCPGPAPLTPEDVARSVRALRNDFVQLRCDFENLRLVVESLALDRLVLQRLPAHFDNIQTQVAFLHGRLFLVEQQVVSLRSCLDTLD